MGLSNLKRTPFLVAIISVAFVGGLFTAAYAGPLPMITFAGNTHTTGDAVVDGTMTADNYFDNGNTQTGTDASALGGIGNTASGIESTVGGGFSNTASGNQATVGGGRDNTASGESSTVGGGSFNTAIVDLSTVGGGDSNTASEIESTVGGGFLNTASGLRSTVGGGILNNAIGESSTVGGGEENTASGKFSTVGGGLENTASGDFSFAAGNSAKAIHDGAFVWADSTFADFTSTAPDQFSIKAAGGIRMVGDLTIESEIFCTDCIDSTDILDGTIQGVDISLPLVLPGTSQFNTVKASLFRDLDDTFFFANPASTSVFKALNVDDVTVANDIICTDCIDSADILDGTITSADLAADAVTSTKIATDAVGHNAIVATAVRTAEIADGQVMTVDLADDAVTGEKIAGTSKLIFGSCDITIPFLNAENAVILTCEQVGVSDGDKVVVNKSGNPNVGGGSCIAIITASGSATNTLEFIFRNTCSFSSSSSPVTLHYIVFRP